MKLSLGILMDPIQSIKIAKDSSFAMLLEAQRRQWDIWYFQQHDMQLQNGRVIANATFLQVEDNPQRWFTPGETRQIDLTELDVILMRKDPPFNMHYIYTTYLLELSGRLVINSPAALRDYNEKLATAWFPQCCAPSMVASRPAQFHEFIEQQGDVILKPLDGMGGESIFRTSARDPNRNVILETLTAHGSKFAMAQKFIPEIIAGDKRILIVNGKPVPYALARIPQGSEHRGNLAAGGSGVGVGLSERDFWICEQLGEELVRRGILFAGIDVIGDYLTEINITSPTCIRELDKIYQLNISGLLMDAIEEKLQA
jgi:glutathione synthase